ncbi:hypothetical protein N3K63_02465 [Microbacterium sp. W1N]|uniref:hypothetical protein n=1 Tax=Microbacterium festucae TaxID=2977531 RepID=UPI0021C1D3FA|nr:hypothetical protein [Microbacterium festucae]MCT9819145.1 hypothetical protein [Microbacterium festucae]
MTSEQTFSDADLWRALRGTWEAADPAPADLAERMIAAVAAADLSREFALLVLVDSDATAAVRGDAEMLTLQFSDGTTSVLVHVTSDSGRRRRLDGWVDGAAREAHLVIEGDDLSAPVVDGRFAFDDVESGIVRLRFALAATSDGPAELLTPRFEI